MNEEKNYYYVTLNCWECDHPTCRLGNMIYENSKDGCVRRVDENLFIEYYHQLKEVWPFSLSSDKEYKKTMETLDKIYNSPCTKKYGRGFKVIAEI